MVKENLKNKLNKFVILDKIIELTGTKVLIYTKYRGLSNYLKNLSYKLNFEYGELNGGNIKQIDGILKEFKSNPNMKILLIDDSYFGVGLNIEYATDFIFIHKTEPEIESQLIGRAQRFGRTEKLNIWKLLYPNEKK
jgi:SNF2 family DNA or RNA helicase